MSLAGRRPRRDRRVGRPTGSFGYNNINPWPQNAPPSTPVLDSFNSGATQLLTARAGWDAAAVWSVGDISWRTDAVPTFADSSLTNGSTHSNFWATQFTANQEVWFTFGSVVGDVYLMARGVALSSSGTNVFDFHVTGSGVTMALEDNAANLVSTNLPAPSPGDSFGLQVVGSILFAWWRPVGGIWKLILSCVNTGRAGAGYIGLLTVGGSTAQIDEFGGGSIPFVPSFATTPEPHVVRRTWAGR